LIGLDVSPAPQPRRTDSVAQPTNKPHQASGAEQKPTTPAPPIIKAIQPEDTSKQGPDVARQNEQQAKDQTVTVRSLPVIETSRDFVDYSQIVLTLLLIFIAVWQIRLLRRTLVATERAADAAVKNADAALKNARAADATATVADKTLAAIETQASHMANGLVLTKQVADAARQSAEAASRNACALEVAERAYVLLDDIALQQLKPQERSVAIFTFKNTGRTPAFINELRVSATIAASLDATPEYSPTPTQAPAAIAAGARITIHQDFTDFTVTSDVYNSLQNGSQKLWIYGVVRYTDSFGHSRQTGFGALYNPSTPPTFLYPDVLGYNYAD
jgi:hypothetical protein